MLNQVNSLLVVHELDLTPRNVLLPVLLLLHLEHVVIEVLLQFLIGVVYAQLLETVLLEYLEAEDVQESDELE